jgi:hypothetical protein
MAEENVFTDSDAERGTMNAGYARGQERKNDIIAVMFFCRSDLACP